MTEPMFEPLTEEKILQATEEILKARAEKAMREQKVTTLEPLPQPRETVLQPPLVRYELTAVDARLHAISLAVAWQQETIQLRRDHSRRAAYELLTSAEEFASWITDGTMPPEPPPLPEKVAS